jgi:hypothetical protein
MSRREKISMTKSASTSAWPPKIAVKRPRAGNSETSH